MFVLLFASRAWLYVVRLFVCFVCLVGVVWLFRVSLSVLVFCVCCVLDLCGWFSVCICFVFS